VSEHRGIRFRIGDAFPGNDQVARWMVVCAMALNDLLLVNRWLLPRLEEKIESEAYENVYLARLAASHLYEIANFLERSDRIPRVQEFIAALDDDVREAYDRVCALGPHSQTQLAKQVRRARNRFFHYVELVPQAEDREILKAAIEAHADTMGEIRDEGNPLDAFRATFADDIAVELSFPDENTELEDVLKEITDHIGAFLKFAFDVLPRYVQRLPSDTWEYIDA